MVSLVRGELLTLAQAASRFPGNCTKLTGDGTLSPETIRRWVKRGVNGVKLEHKRAGLRILTWERALEDFIDACTAAEEVIPQVTTCAGNAHDQQVLQQRHRI